ncbi:serine hydrolase domain-containing protein [Streptomyces sp. NPDC059629]|uniref:serine hydrolase domain-containing protein n=1 Tax=Streptomyces sp. NPDC059629 TaxID=3346889 RepID=UPI00368EE1EA
MNGNAALWPEAFHGLHDRLVGLLDRIPMAGVQLSVSRDGVRLLDAGLGEARPGVHMTADSVLYWSCAGKPLLATVLATCVEEGRIRFEDAVADHLPAFAANGKGAVTVADVLSHTGGFPEFRGHPVRDTYADFLAEVLGLPLKPGWVTGKDQGYHQETAWYVVAALIESLLGEDYRDAFVRRLCAPLGLEAWPGMSAESHDRNRHLLAVPTATATQGVRSFPYVISRVGIQAKIPSYGYYGTMAHLARFYEAALAGLRGEGAFPVSPPVLSAMATAPRGPVHDRTWGYVCGLGLGFFTGLRDHGGYGSGWSASSFGASGRVGQVYGGADPETGVVVAASFGALAFDAATRNAVMDELYAAALA